MLNRLKSFVKTSELWEKIIYVVSILGGILLFLFVFTSIWLGHGVKTQCQTAQKTYGGNCIEALSAYINDSNNHTLKERNQAVWALGQLGDKRALPTLQSYYTGEECDHEKYLCQYELKKAIRMCQGEFNITAFVWRNGIINTN